MSEKLNIVRTGGAVKRYHTAATLGTQNVAEHSFRVALICYIINPNSSRELILHALAHDLSEGITGDIPAPAKRVLKTAELAEMEESVVNTMLPGLPELSEYEKKILKLADCLEGLLYCVEQRALGNTTMHPIMGKYCSYLIEHGAAAIPGAEDMMHKLLGEYYSYEGK